jgi:WD40 repeat protein
MYPESCTLEGCSEIIFRSRMRDHYHEHVQLLTARINRLEETLKKKDRMVEELNMRENDFRQHFVVQEQEQYSRSIENKLERESMGTTSCSVVNMNERLSRNNNSMQLESIPVFNELKFTDILTESHGSAVYTLVISDSDDRLFSGSGDNTIKVWNTVSKTCITTLEGHKHWVYCLCLSPKQQMLFSGSYDTTIKVWDTRTWQCIHTLEGHTFIVRSLVVDESDDRLYSASDDNTIKVWDLRTLTCIRTLQGHSNSVLCLCLSPTSNILYSAS